MAKHTKLPWTVQRLNHAGGETWIQIGWIEDGREIGPVAEMVGGAVKDPVPVWHPVATMKYLVTPDEQIMANAEFIVTACNLHDELVSALKDIIADYEDRGASEASINKARAAIQKATSSTQTGE
jgi:hypothetical protein